MNIGIVGTGSIARTMLAEFRKTASLHCAAVCSRKEESGRAFAAQFGIPKVYTSLDAMLADTAVDLIYIATPNALHYAQARAALLAGKDVLCEKPFVTSAAQADDLIALAKQKQRLLFEAVTTTYHPNYALARQYLAQIAPIKAVVCIFCQYSSRYPALLRGETPPVFDPKLCGGALMDLNFYNIHFAVGLFGEPRGIHYFANRHENGVDTGGVLVLEYPGFLCECTAAKDCAGKNSAQLLGAGGSIAIEPGSSNCRVLELSVRGEEPVRACVEENPWHYEVAALEKLFAARDFAACYRALETSRTVAAVLEAARQDAGLGY